MSYSRSALRSRKLKNTRTTDLKEFIDTLPGFKKVRLRPGEPKTRFTYDGQDLIAFTWIPSRAVDAYATANYIQVDCSFKGSKPFCYCVPQAIIMNESVGLGLIIAPSESGFIYKSFFEDLQSLDPELVLDKPVLSDQGSGIGAWVDSTNAMSNRMEHFFCHRHLIEKFGSSSSAGMLVARALRELSPESFTAHFPQLMDDLNACIAKGLITEKKAEKLRKFLSPPFSHGIWRRIERGISSCSNHAERFHGMVNAKIRGIKMLVRRLEVIVRLINDRFAAYTACPRRQVGETVDVLKKLQAEQTRQCHDPECVIYRQMMCNRFGARTFPCRHMVQECKVDLHALPEVKEREVNSEVARQEIDPHDITIPDGFYGKAQTHVRRGKKGNVPLWEDTATFQQHEALQAVKEAAAYYEHVVRITNSVMYLRANSKDQPAVSRDYLLLAILDFVRTQLPQFSLDDEHNRKILGECLAEWCYWALHNGKQPNGNAETP
jgi:hypothetical protein